MTTAIRYVYIYIVILTMLIFHHRTFKRKTTAIMDELEFDAEFDNLTEDNRKSELLDVEPMIILNKSEDISETNRSKSMVVVKRE